MKPPRRASPEAAARCRMPIPHLDDRSTDTKWNARLALDALAGPPRELPAWQEWARGKGYLPENGTKP